MRIDRDTYFLEMATLVAKRGTCIRREVGCVLVNDKYHVLATGYNGVASGLTHCIDKPCPGAKKGSGTALEECEAIHAEQNALLQCKDIFGIKTCYCTTSPCITCTKLLLNTSCNSVIYLEEYPNSGEKLWRKAKRYWRNDYDREFLETTFGPI
jgi:dCMP deaminase